MSVPKSVVPAKYREILVKIWLRPACGGVLQVRKCLRLARVNNNTRCMQFFSFVDRYNGDVHRAGIAFSSWQLVFDAICEILPAMLRNVIGLYLILITRRELVTNLQFNSTVGRNGTGMEL